MFFIRFIEYLVFFLWLQVQRVIPLGLFFNKWIYFFNLIFLNVKFRMQFSQGSVNFFYVWLISPAFLSRIEQTNFQSAFAFIIFSNCFTFFTKFGSTFTVESEILVYLFIYIDSIQPKMGLWAGLFCLLPAVELHRFAQWWSNFFSNSLLVDFCWVVYVLESLLKYLSFKLIC